MPRYHDFVDDVTGEYIDRPAPGALPVFVRIQVQQAPGYGAAVAVPHPRLSPLLNRIGQLATGALEVSHATWERLVAADATGDARALDVAFACVRAQRCVGLPAGNETPSDAEVRMALAEADAGRLTLDPEERAVLAARLPARPMDPPPAAPEPAP